MKKPVRVRFAPSPTGPLHIGGVRTALFNYLFAKQHHGVFVLRIEDTDQSRFVPGAEAYITDALEWCGIPFDEGPGKDGGYGPYRQSERIHLYRNYAEQLVASGHAYYAFDTPETLGFHRKDHESKGKTFIYNWHNRGKLSNSLSMSATEVAAKLSSGTPYVIRFKSPENKTITLTDVVRGQINIATNTLDDKILFKSDGFPTYHLANIVDDHLMDITHVIRGEEWLPSLALHHQLYEAFGWEPPIFAHLPLILKPTGKGKLSKRDGEKGGFPVFPLAWQNSPGYRESGFFPEAVINFLAFLGWNPGNEEELFSLEELINLFSLERVQKSGARFDPEKTKWYNHQWLQRKSPKELAAMVKPLLQDKQVSAALLQDNYLENAIALLQERADFVSDFWDLGHYFFEVPTSFSEKAVNKHWKPDTSTIIQRLLELVSTIDDFTSAHLETVIKQWITSEELSFGKVMAPLRLALVGDLKGPHLFDIMAQLGKAQTIAHLRNALHHLS